MGKDLLLAMEDINVNVPSGAYFRKLDRYKRTF